MVWHNTVIAEQQWRFRFFANNADAKLNALVANLHWDLAHLIKPSDHFAHFMLRFSAE